jgi:hypothetical protein
MERRRPACPCRFRIVRSVRSGHGAQAARLPVEVSNRSFGAERLVGGARDWRHGTSCEPPTKPLSRTFSSLVRPWRRGRRHNGRRGRPALRSVLLRCDRRDLMRGVVGRGHHRPERELIIERLDTDAECLNTRQLRQRFHRVPFEEARS